MSLSPRTGSVRSVERALDLLLLLEKADGPVGVRELARVADMPRATVHRLLAVLETRAFVQSDQGRYRIGPGIVPVAGAFLVGDSLTRAARPVLERLTSACGETSTLSVRQGFDRVAIQRVHSPHTLLYTIRVGQRLPLHLGAAGLVLAAAMPAQEWEQLLDQLGEVRLASGEALTREQLTERVERVRRQGFAVSREERDIGVVSVAAPILAPNRSVIAAISVTGPPTRMTAEKVEDLSVEVRRSAEEISISYGRM